MQVQNSLREKEAELEKLQCTTKELDTSLQEARQSTSKIDCEALRAEIQKLKDSLEEAREQLKVSGETQTHHTSNPLSPHPPQLHLVAPRSSLDSPELSPLKPRTPLKPLLSPPGPTIPSATLDE